MAEPRELTIEEAGKAYLAMVGPVNATLDAEEAEAKKSHPNIAVLRDLASKAGDALAQSLRVAASTKWPKVVQKDMDQWMSENAEVLSATRRASKAKTLSEYEQAYEWLPQSSVSQVVRAKLGLPEVPTA